MSKKSFGYVWSDHAFQGDGPKMSDNTIPIDSSEATGVRTKELDSAINVAFQVELRRVALTKPSPTKLISFQSYPPG
jgi:hypothetical protein